MGARMFREEIGGCQRGGAQASCLQVCSKTRGVANGAGNFDKPEKLSPIIMRRCSSVIYSTSSRASSFVQEL
jgi:hypothetical protein